MCQPLRMLGSKRNPKGRISGRQRGPRKLRRCREWWRSKGCPGGDARNLARRGEGTCGQGGLEGSGAGRGCLEGSEARGRWRWERVVLKVETLGLAAGTRSLGVAECA